MIVDDSATMRKIIARTLRQAGVQIDATLEAANGIEAMEHIANNPDIDLVLSDVNMPDMDGIDLVRRLRRLKSAEQLSIIMISAEGGDARRSAAMKEGADGYITKPFTPETMLSALEPYLG